jgi:hypothetical protein
LNVKQQHQRTAPDAPWLIFTSLPAFAWLAQDIRQWFCMAVVTNFP